MNYLKKLFLTSHLDRHSTTKPKPDMLSAVSTRSRIWHHWKIAAALCMQACTEKTTNEWKKEWEEQKLKIWPKK